MNTIDRSELTDLIARGGITLLEALPEQHYRKGHLPGARLFPHDKVRDLAPSVLPDKVAPVVVYCTGETCPNSHQAAAELVALGYLDVRVYVGGKQDWQAAGLPLEQ